MTWLEAEACASTQDEAVAALATQADPSMIVAVLAERQNLGRGRQGRAWHSPAGGGIYLSIAVPGPVASAGAEQWPRRVVESAVEVLAAEVGVAARVREPNDLYVEERKLGGVLIDTVSYSERSFDRVVIGIGVNVFGAPGDIDGRATTSVEASSAHDADTLATARPRVARAIAYAALAAVLTSRN